MCRNSVVRCTVRGQHTAVHAGSSVVHTADYPDDCTDGYSAVPDLREAHTDRCHCADFRCTDSADCHSDCTAADYCRYRSGCFSARCLH